MPGIPPSLFIAGIGNSLRRDDGIGPYIAQEISCLPLRQADISFPIELNVEWLEILARFEIVLLVDAAADGSDQVRLEKVDPAAYKTTRASHYLDPDTIILLISELFGTKTQLYTCAVPGYDFSMGEGLSVAGKAKADEAIAILRQWLHENGYMAGESA